MDVTSSQKGKSGRRFTAPVLSAAGTACACYVLPWKAVASYLAASESYQHVSLRMQVV